VLEQYKRMRLPSTADEVSEKYKLFKEYMNAVKNDKAVKIKYHW